LRNLDSTLDAVARRCPWERHLMLFPILRSRSLPLLVAQPEERHTNRTAFVLEWYDRHRAYNNQRVQTKKASY